MWFTANILMKALSSNSTAKPFWEESAILIQATDEDEARKKGEEAGKKAEHEYDPISGDHIKWIFEKVTVVYEITPNKLEEGTEVFSRFLRDSEVKSLSRPFEDDEI
jgi:hypothetical protein